MVRINPISSCVHGGIANRAWLAGLAGAILLFAAPPARATASKCLEDPADVGQITTLRDAIESGCPCGNYTGATGAKHGDYVRCAKRIIGQQPDGNLRPQCRGTVKKFYAQSTCGLAAALDKTVCVKTNENTGKITCAIKAANKCVDKPSKYSQRSCAGLNEDWTHCIDAADSNHDLSIGTGDSGVCNCNAGFSDCNNNRTDGCEVNTIFDADNCGSCAHVCIAATGGSRFCYYGSCASLCNPGQVCGSGPDGGGVCKDTTTDVANCGACGAVCPLVPGESCVNGFCGPQTLRRGNVAGGTAYADSCAFGDVTGLNVWIENGHIGRIQGVCTGFLLNLPVVSMLPTHGIASPAAQEVQLNCPEDAAFTAVGGFSGRSDGAYLVALTIRCAQIQVSFVTNPDNSETITGFSVGAPADLGTAGDMTGSAFPVTDCQPGTVAAGINLNVDVAIRAFGLTCLPPPVPVGTTVPAGCL